MVAVVAGAFDSQREREREKELLRVAYYKS
jgi:hypothetical protein